jgi:hypothetical protein
MGMSWFETHELETMETCQDTESKQLSERHSQVGGHRGRDLSAFVDMGIYDVKYLEC